jgi:hypothetical protein
MVSMINEHDVVRLVREIPAIGLSKDQVGVVVFIYTSDNLPAGFEVEFFNDAGETIAVETINIDDVTLIEKAKDNS